MQFNFSVPGGGGSCSYDNGLGSFESVVGNIASKFMVLDQTAMKLNGLTTSLSPMYNKVVGTNPTTGAPITLGDMAGVSEPAAIGVNNVGGYDMESYMEGRQYYFGFQLGAAYKLNPSLSVRQTMILITVPRPQQQVAR